MNTQNTSLELEVMPPEVQAVSKELAAPENVALAAFTPFQKLFAGSSVLLAKECAATTPKDARALRLEMRSHRSETKKVKDSVKADILLAGRLADSFFNRVTGPLENAEARLDEIEKAEERRIAAEKAALKTARLAELAAFGVNAEHYGLDNLPAADYAQLVAQSRLAHEAKARAEREEAAHVAKVEREAREAMEAKERERIAAEQKRIADEAAAATRAAAAPDKEKLVAFAEKLKAVALPEMATEKGKAASARVSSAIEGIIELIRNEYKQLGK
jgi:hypothetical protein